jgi:hypothetical protein
MSHEVHWYRTSSEPSSNWGRAGGFAGGMAEVSCSKAMSLTTHSRGPFRPFWESFLVLLLPERPREDSTLSIADSHS